MPVITYASRNLEPMRGFDRFLHGLVVLQQRKPEAQVLIAGSSGSSYSGSPAEGKTWKDVACEAVEGRLNLERVHFLGHLSHDNLVRVFRRSNLHVYLSNSFVLSWSVLEAMACGAPILAEDNAMLRELEGLGGSVGFCRSGDAKALGEQMAKQLEQQPASESEPRQLSPKLRLSHTLTSLEGLIERTVGGRF